MKIRRIPSSVLWQFIKLPSLFRERSRKRSRKSVKKQLSVRHTHYLKI